MRLDVSVLVPEDDCTEEYIDQKVEATLKRAFPMVTIHSVEKETD